MVGTHTHRCHPVLGTLASDLFYQSKLINGVTNEARRPLVKDWPALMVFNSSGSKEELQQTGSIANLQEARFIVYLVSQLVPLFLI